MHRNQKGFTLVEIAIVLVIIGLLIGGVLKGQAMIQNAKVKRVVKSADELRAAIYTFYDKYGKFPGDEDLGSSPSNDTNDGNGNGAIQGNERFWLFQDLILTDIINGSYQGNVDDSFPNHAFGGKYFVEWQNRYGVNSNFIQFNTIPAGVALEIDTKYDDGVFNTGSIKASANFTTVTTTVELYMVL